MTTITYRDRKMVSDGQVSFGGRVDDQNFKKIRKINGCLVGGAGRLTSVLQFFEWFEEWSNAQQVQGDAPHVRVFVPEGIEDEDFSGLVVFADGIIFLYEGGKNSYQLAGQEYFSIGSGADFALAAMDAGANAMEAVAVAIKRDVYSGGEIFAEELDPEPVELTRELAQDMEKEELISLLFGEKAEEIEVVSEQAVEAIEKPTEDVLVFGKTAVTLGGKVIFANPENGDTLATICLEDSEMESKAFKKVCKTLKRDYLNAAAEELGYQQASLEASKSDVLDRILTIVQIEHSDFVEEAKTVKEEMED